MCQSKAEGGQRCAAHTAAALAKAKEAHAAAPASRRNETSAALANAFVEYASTNQGERDLRKRVEAPNANPVDVIALKSAIRQGWRLREERRAEAQKLVSARVKYRAEAVRNATTPLSPKSFDAMEGHTEWLGHGYLLERHLALEDGDAATIERVRKADEAAVEAATAAGLTYEETFEWANGMHGRWYAECTIGDPKGLHTEKYLPKPIPKTGPSANQWYTDNNIEIGYPKTDVEQSLSARYPELTPQYCRDFVLKDQPDVISDKNLRAAIQSLDVDQREWDYEHGTETKLAHSGIPATAGISRTDFVAALAARHELETDTVEEWVNENTPPGDWLTTDTANFEGVTARFDNAVEGP